MTTSERVGSGATSANRQSAVSGTESLLWVHVKATLAVLLEFIALQLVAVGLATGIYSLVPLLDLEFKRGFDDWMRAFQILSPTLSVSGGAAIVLSSYFFHKLARETDQRANQQVAEANQQAAEASQQAAEANQQAAEASQRAAVAESANAELRTELTELRSQLAELRAEQAARPARRRRRSLR